MTSISSSCGGRPLRQGDVPGAHAAGGKGCQTVSAVLAWERGEEKLSKISKFAFCCPNIVGIGDGKIKI